MNDAEIERAMFLVRTNLDAVMSADNRSRLLIQTLSARGAPQSIDDVLDICDDLGASVGRMLGPDTAQLFEARCAPLRSLSIEIVVDAMVEPNTTKSLPVLDAFPVPVLITSAEEWLRHDLHFALSQEQARLDWVSSIEVLTRDIVRRRPQIVVVDEANMISDRKAVLDALQLGRPDITVVWIGSKPPEAAHDKILIHMPAGQESVAALCDLILSRRAI
jgi:hypothetical protein